MTTVWLGPGIVRIDGKILKPGEKIIKKSIPGRTWDAWIRAGRIGEPPAEPIAATAETDRLMARIAELEAALEAMAAEKEQSAHNLHDKKSEDKK